MTCSHWRTCRHTPCITRRDDGARYCEAIRGARVLRSFAYGAASTYVRGGRRLGPAHADELAYGVPVYRTSGVAATVRIGGK